MKKGEGPDVTKFEGTGLSFKAKLIGVEDVPEARGDQMCQETLLRLKNAVRASGEHKQKVFVNVTLEGLKIVDAISLAVLHSHAVHRISFISRDTTDSRAFGYIYGDTDNTHKFFAIKTASAAEQLVYTIRDLFQAVYDLKKKEMEEAKTKLESGEVTTTDEGNSQTPGNGSTSGTAQTPLTKVNVDGENIYQVPPNNAPVKQAEQVANLLDLEDQTEHILKGIEQIKNLDFDSITDEQQPTSPVSPPVQSGTASNPDPWGMGATTTAPVASTGSALGDLAGLQTSPFPTLQGGMQPFPGTAFPMQAGYGAPQPFGAPAGGLPVTRDPFANDPFSVNAAQRPAGPPGGAFPAANPFGAPQQQQAFGAFPPRGMMPPGAVMPGAAPSFMPQQAAGFGQMAAPGRAPNPFGAGFGQMPQMAAPAQPSLFGDVPDNPNLLQPVKLDDGSTPKDDAADKAAAPNKMRNDLFGDLVFGDIKKDPITSGASTPKDMFAMASASEKKSMNQLMSSGAPPPPARPDAAQNSLFGDAFGVPPQPVNGNTSEKSLFD